MDVKNKLLRIIRVEFVDVLIGVGGLADRAQHRAARTVHYSSHIDHYVLLAVDVVVHAVLYGTDVTVVSQPRALEAI